MNLRSSSANQLVAILCTIMYNTGKYCNLFTICTICTTCTIYKMILYITLNTTMTARAKGADKDKRGTPTGFTVDAAPPGDLGAALVGRQLLYWWPDDGWQRGTVARLCPRGAFSHVVALLAYTRQTSALRGTADSLLDSASYGARWVLLSPAPAAGVVAGSRARRPRP
jgi:hypothetical protein